MRSLITIGLLFWCFACALKKEGKDVSLNKGIAAAIYKKLSPCAIEGSPDSALCATYAVLENRQSKQGRKINLNIIVIPALQQDSIHPPLFCFDGGPGVAATSGAGFYAAQNNPYRRYHDIVMIDVRGTGQSNPLNCRSLQYKAGLAEHFSDMYPREAVKECYDSLSKQADLTQYTTTNIALDIEDVRRWLGYEQIHLFGLSYGTRLALEYMRRFPEAVATTVLWSPTPTYGRMPLYHASFAQQTLEKLFDDCRNDSICNSNFPQLQAEFNRLMTNGRMAPFKFSHTTTDGKVLSLTVPWDAFQTKIRTLMYMPFTLRQIPFIVHEADRGNWKPFVSLFPEKAGTDDFLAEGLYLCITCSEDVPFITERETEALTKGTFMGNYRIAQQQLACANWIQGNIPEDFMDPVVSDIPVLILTGSYDPVTPVSMAKEIASHLPNSQVVQIPEMAHTFDGLSNEDCFDQLVVEFINHSGKSVLNTNCAESMQPPPFKVAE